jgi:hypothetical protein
MEQSPWEADSHSSTQEIIRLFLQHKVQYCVHKSQPYNDKYLKIDFKFKLTYEDDDNEMA